MNANVKGVAMFARRNDLSRILAVIAAFALTLLLAACGKGATASEAPASQPASQAPESAAPQQANGTPVSVALGETDTSHMYMKVDTLTVPAGPVTFNVVNEGVKTHEFVVLRTDTAAADFPIVSFEGEKDRIDEDTAGENLGETGDMEAGTTKSLTIDLAPGHYALVCNLPGHYRMGMLADFQVT